MAKKLIRHELVEITIPAGSTLTRFQFPDIPNLRNSHLWALQVYYGPIDNVTPPDPAVNQLITKGIQTGLNVISNVKLRSCFITFVNYGGKEFLKQAPALNFQTQFAGPTGPIVPMEWDTKTFVGQKVSYPKSYLEFNAPPAQPTESTVFMCSILYSLPFAEEKKESGYAFSKQG